MEEESEAEHRLQVSGGITAKAFRMLNELALASIGTARRKSVLNLRVVRG
jgi:hypothetical protein